MNAFRNSIQRIVEGARSPTFPWLLPLFVWGIWILEPFYGVGMATQDQLEYSLGQVWGSELTPVYHAELQGRIYFLFTKTIDIFLAGYADVFWTKAITIAVFSLAPLCFGYAFFRSNTRRLLFAWVFFSLVWQGFMHLPPAAYPVVNHLPFLFWALFAWVARRAEGNLRSRFALGIQTGILSFVSFFQYEPVALMGGIVLLWIVYASNHDHSTKKLLYKSIAIAGAVYGALYVGWAWIHPSTYEGLAPGSSNPLTILKVIVAYTVGAFPFHSDYYSSLCLKWGDSLVGGAFDCYILNWSYSFDLLALAITGTAIGAMLAFACRAGSRRRLSKGPKLWHAWTVLALLIVAANGLLGFSGKYQSWIIDWSDTYLTSNLALFPICGGIVLLISWLGRVTRFRDIPIGLCLAIVWLGFCSIKARQQNAQLAVAFRSNVARWEAVSAFAQYAGKWNAETIVAPQLYFGRYAEVADWADYWMRYSMRRFGEPLSFSAEFDATVQAANPQAIASIYTHEDGRLRAITVQTEEATYVISRKSSRPPMLYSSAGVGIVLNWKYVRKNEWDFFEMVEVRDSKAHVGLDRNLTLSWSLPRF